MNVIDCSVNDYITYIDIIMMYDCITCCLITHYSYYHLLYTKPYSSESINRIRIY